MRYQGNDPFAGGAITFPSPKNYVFPTPYSMGATAPGFLEPVYQQRNLTVERQLLSPSLMVSISYQGSHGTHMERTYDPHMPIYVAGSSTVPKELSRRPYPEFSEIAILRSDAYESYNALVIQVKVA